ncbi:hypothetical protein ACEZCY_30910 [Streptacidiphilus sp. N1-12]|uniref:Uncharacterized protein n=2 Tax=Streptacidiphilus alkalitolerans TaxID=3342712 RepID=A0ABV6VHZ7_9ACTN
MGFMTTNSETTTDELKRLKGEVKLRSVRQESEIDPVADASVDLRIAELELAEAEAKVLDLTTRLESGAGPAPSASTLATAKAASEHARGVVKGKTAALARAKDTERVAKLTALSDEVSEYATSGLVDEIAKELTEAISHLSAFESLVRQHNEYLRGVAAEAKSLGVSTAGGPAVPDPATGGIRVVPDTGTRIFAGTHQVRSLDAVSLIARSRGDDGIEKVAQGVRSTVVRPVPDPTLVYYRDRDGGSLSFPRGEEPGEVQASFRGLTPLDYSDVWPSTS